jgi:penicillin-binding protein 2
MQRILILRVVLILVMTVLAGRLYQLQLSDSDAQRYGSSSIDVITKRHVYVSPRRGEIFASDGATLLSESVPIFSIAVLPGGLPASGTNERTEVLGRLAQLASITGTLTVSPSLHLERTSALRADLDELGLSLPSDVASGAGEPLTLEVPPAQTLALLRLSEVYSDIVRYDNPLHRRIENSTVRGYQTLIVKENVSQNLTLILRENSHHLPGVVVVEDYWRRYPQSAAVPSLSHLLGYIGRIGTCELAAENPESSWLSSLVDVVSHAPRCGLLAQEIDPGSVGNPRYKHDDRIGKDGLEAGYEHVLRGTMGVQTLGVDVLERPVSAPYTVRPVTNGNNLVLSIDVGFQKQVERILQRWIDESERRRVAAGGYRSEYDPITNGVAVVMNVRDGRVLAMVSLPAYDNNVWVDHDRADELQELLSPSDPERRAELARLAPLTNSAAAGRYPPGSSIKPFVGAAALQEGVIQPDTLLRDPGRILLRERTGHIFELPNSTPQDNGEIDISEALRVSSNVFFAALGGGNDQATNLGDNATTIRGLKIDGLARGLEWFGFGSHTGAALPGEAAGRVPTPNWKSHTLREPWTTGDTYNTSIGQGYLEVTPLQLTSATAALANDGVLLRPRLVQAIMDSNGDILHEYQPDILSEVPVDDGYLRVVREGLRRSVTEGRNVAARDACSGLSIAGKTGTAEFGPNIITPEGKITRQSHSWFVGFAPYENPEIAVVVLLEGTGDLDDGSATLAVPAVTQIMQSYFQVTPPADTPYFCPALPQDTPPAPPEPQEP